MIPGGIRLAGIVAIIVSLGVSLSGLLLFGWDWRQIVVLYWLTNVTVGVMTLIDIARADTKVAPIPKTTGGTVVVVPPVVAKLLIGGFFSVHYGMFTLVHGIFVFMLVSGGLIEGTPGTPIDYGQLFGGWALTSLASIAAKLMMPYQSPSIVKMFVGPYKRIIALHLSIILGAFLIQMLGLPSAAALLLVGLNTVFELNEFRPRNVKPLVYTEDQSRASTDVNVNHKHQQPVVSTNGIGVDNSTQRL